jgi:hypothetical protein
MDDGEMMTGMASSDGSHEKIEKKEGKGRKGGNEGSLWFDDGRGRGCEGGATYLCRGI